METIQVTINPDGVSCTEVMNLTAPRRKERPGDRIRELNDLMNMKPLRTFEIEREECTCVKDIHKCKKWCTINTPVIFLSISYAF